MLTQLFNINDKNKLNKLFGLRLNSPYFGFEMSGISNLKFHKFPVYKSKTFNKDLRKKEKTIKEKQLTVSFIQKYILVTTMFNFKIQLLPIGRRRWEIWPGELLLFSLVY